MGDIRYGIRIESKSDNGGIKAAEADLRNLKTAADNASSSARNLGQNQKLLANEYAAIRSRLDPAYAATKRYQESLNSLSNALHAGYISQQQHMESVRQLRQEMNSGSDSVNKMATSVKGLGYAYLAYKAVDIAGGILETRVQADKLSNTLKFATGGVAAAAREQEYLKEITSQLGLEFNSTAFAYAKLAAASKGTSLEGQKTRDVFNAVARASTVMGLSAEESGGALLAISQMISKGTVSAEELRGQLGERLPGAFQIAARSMGMTTAELGKMLEQGGLATDVFLPKFAEELNKSLGNDPESAANSAQANLNKLSNSWLDLKKAAAESIVMTIVVKTIGGAAELLGPRTSSKADQKYKLEQLMGQSNDNSGWFGALIPQWYKDSVEERISQQRDGLGITQASMDTRLITPGPVIPGILNGKPVKDSVGGYGPGIEVMQKQQQEDLRTRAEAQRKSAEAAKKHKEELDKLTSAEQSYMSGVSILADNIIKLNVPEKSHIQLLRDQLDATLRIPPEIRAVLQAELDQAEAQETLNAQLKQTLDLMEATQQYDDAAQAIYDANSQTYDSILRETEDINAQMVLSDEDRARKQLEIDHNRRVERIANMEGEADQIASIQEAENARYAASVSKVAFDKFSATWNSLEDVAHQTWDSIFDGGADAVTRLKNTFKNTFFDWLYQMTLKKWIFNIGATISGSGAAGSALAAGEIAGIPSGGGDGGGAGSVIGVLKSGFDLVSGTVAESVSSLAGTIGGDIGQFMLGNAGTIGTAISAIGLGIGVVGLLSGGLGGLFGGGHISRPKEYANTMVGANSVKTLATWTNSDGGAQGQAKAYGTDFGGYIQRMAAVFGASIEKGFIVGTKYMQKYNALGVVVGQGATKTNSEYQIHLDNKGELAGGAALAFITAINRGLVKTDGYVKNILAERTPAGTNLLNAKAILNDVFSIKQLYEAIGDMPSVFGHVRDFIKTMTGTAQKVQMNALKDATQNFYDLFYSDAEKLTDTTKYLHAQFEKLGLSFPDTAAGYKSLVESQTGAMYAALVNLATPMDNYYKALSAQADVTERAARASRLNAEYFSSIVDFNAAKARIMAGQNIRIPGFATGGDFTGGMRIVGERGPELEFTGPSRIMSNSDLMSRLRDPQQNPQAVLNALRALIEAVNTFKANNSAENISIARHLAEASKNIKRQTNDGIIVRDVGLDGAPQILKVHTV